MSIDEEVSHFIGFLFEICIIRPQVVRSEELGEWDAVFGTTFVRLTIVKIGINVSGFIVKCNVKCSCEYCNLTGNKLYLSAKMQDHICNYNIVLII